MKIIGHRGARGLAPENTIAGFKKALEHHVDEIELDVRISKDNKTVLAHNTYVSDAAGNEIDIVSHTFAELQQHKPDITSLEDALESIHRKVPAYIEVKPGVPAEPIIEVIHNFLDRGWTNSDFLLASYSQPVLLELHQALPDIQKVVIEDWSGIRAWRRARQVNTKRLSMLEYWLWPGFISSMSRRGFELYSFPPKKHRKLAALLLGEHTNVPNKARAWAKAGLAGVITDYPDRFEK
jgi:glycerophosphoryl diester phosphodiesterase